MIELIIGQIWPYLALIAAGIAAFVGIRQSGKSAARNEINEASTKARKEARNVETEIDSLADADVDSRLRDWLRDPGK